VWQGVGRSEEFSFVELFVIICLSRTEAHPLTHTCRGVGNQSREAQSSLPDKYNFLTSFTWHRDLVRFSKRTRAT